MPRTENNRGLGHNMETTVTGDEWGGGVVTYDPENDPRNLRTDGGHSSTTISTDNRPGTTAPIESPDDNTSHTGDHAEATPSAPPVVSPETPVATPTGPVVDLVKKSDFYIYRLVKKFGKTFLKNEPAGKQTKIGEGMDIHIENGKIVGKDRPVVPVTPIDVCVGHTVPLNTIEVEYVSPFIALVRINKDTMKGGYELMANYPQESGTQVEIEKCALDKFGNYMYVVNRYRTDLYGIIEHKSEKRLTEVYVQDRGKKLFTKDITFPAHSVISEFEAGSHKASIASRCINDSSKLVMMSAWDFDDSNLKVHSGSTTIGEYLIVLYATDKGKEMAKTNPVVLGPRLTPSRLGSGSNIVPLKDFSKNSSKDIRDNFKWLAIKIMRNVRYGRPLKYYEFDTSSGHKGFQLTSSSFPSTNGLNQAAVTNLLNAALNVTVPKTHPDAPNMTICEDYMWTLDVNPDGTAHTPPAYVKTIGGIGTSLLPPKPVPPTPKPVPPTPAPEKPKIYKMRVYGVDTSVGDHFALKIHVEDGIFKEGRKFVVTYSDGSVFTAGDHGSVVSKYPDSLDIFRVPQYKNGDSDQSIKVKYAKVVSTDSSDHTEYAWFTWG